MMRRRRLVRLLSTSRPANGWPRRPAMPVRRSATVVVYMWYRNPEIVAPMASISRGPATDDRPAIELYDVDTGKLLRNLTPKFSWRRGQAGSGSILKFKFSCGRAIGVRRGSRDGRNRKRLFHGASFRLHLEGGDGRSRAKHGPESGHGRLLARGVEPVAGGRHGHVSRWPTRGPCTLHGRPYERQFESTPIEIWEVASGDKRGELKGPRSDRRPCVFSRRSLPASSSDDTTVLIWDLHRPLQPLQSVDAADRKRTRRLLADLVRARRRQGRSRHLEIDRLPRR